MEFPARIIKTAKLRFKKGWEEDKWFWVGMAGVVLVFIGGVSLRAVVMPWLLSADAPFHLDYAWRLYQGGLPQFLDELALPGLSGNRFHLTSQHPPLYYALLAPFVGPFLANGSLDIATGVGRMFSLGLGLLSALSLAWLAWLVGGRYRRVMAIAAPTIAITFASFIGVVATVYNDSLLVPMSTVTLSVAVLTLYRGPKISYIGCLAVISLLGMATKVSFLSVFFVATGALMGSFIIHGTDALSKRMLKGLGCAAAIAILVGAGIGWFYYFHNFTSSGSFISAQPDSFTPKRSYKPLTKVVTSKELWSLVPLQRFGHSFHEIGKYVINQWLSLSVFMLAAAGFLLWAIRRRVWSLINKKHAIGISIIVVFGMLFVLVFTQQIIYATGFGALLPRYLLPAWPVIGLFLAFGVSAWPKLRGLGVMFMTLIGWAALINWTVFNLTTRTGLPAGQGRLHLLQAGAAGNGFPPEIVPVLLFTLLVGLFLVAIALWKLTGPEARKLDAEKVAKK